MGQLMPRGAVTAGVCCCLGKTSGAWFALADVEDYSMVYVKARFDPKECHKAHEKE